MSTDVDAPTDIAGAGEGGGEPEHLDVVIVGAGLSGIGTACHLEREQSGRDYAILEARDDLGGTWSLFRYPGIRSDSDMHTLGFAFRPWPDTVALADGSSILEYVRDTAQEYGVDRHIRYGTRVTHAAWSSARAALDADPHHGDGREAADLLLPALVLRLLPLRPGLHPGAARHRELRRHGRAPAALGPGAGLRRQAGRRHRLRRHRGHARPRHDAGGGPRRPRHPAAAHPELRALHRPHRPGGGVPEPLAAVRGSPTRSCGRRTSPSSSRSTRSRSGSRAS